MPTGLNWSKVSVILLEIDFLTNRSEDRFLKTSSYQTKVVDALVRAILTFIGARHGPEGYPAGERIRTPQSSQLLPDNGLATVPALDD